MSFRWRRALLASIVPFAIVVWVWAHPGTPSTNNPEQASGEELTTGTEERIETPRPRDTNTEESRALHLIDRITGRSIPDTIVEALSPDGEVAARVTTDSSGTARLEGPHFSTSSCRIHLGGWSGARESPRAPRSSRMTSTPPT